MYCTNCGALNSDNAAFCTNCGAALQSAPVNQNDPQPACEENPQPVNENPAEPVYQNPAEPVNEQYSEPIPEVTPMPEKDPGKALGITALILGIFGLACGTICSCLAAFCGGFLPLVAAIIGIVLGSIGLKKSAEAGYTNKMAKIGRILSIVAIIVIVLFILLNAILGGLLSATGFYEDLMYELY